MSNSPPIRYPTPLHQSDREFLSAYQRLRKDESRGSIDPNFYLRLPEGDFTGQRRIEWRMRRQSLEWLRGYLGERFGEEEEKKKIVILDAGAGNCWLSRYLAEWGFTVTALDLNDDDEDGLGAGQYYLQHLPISFERVCASFEKLPFREERFNVILFNGALHYAEDLQTVLAEGVRVLTSEGVIVVMDSPIYHDAESGRMMVEERGGPARARFLTYQEMERIAQLLSADHSLTVNFFSRPQPFLHSLRHAILKRRLGREPASMPWIVIEKKSNDHTR